MSPNKHRLVQVRRTGSRKLFDARRKALFLEWFAATCNAVLSAAKAGVCYQTVFKHRAKDPEFEAGWDEAVQQGYARIEARLVQEGERRLGGLNPAPRPLHHPADGPPPSAGIPPNEVRRSLEARSARPGEDLGEEFDPELAMQLLREHKRRLAGSSDKRKNLRTNARAATEQEVIAALEKRLKGFALRHGSGQALRQRRSGKKKD